MPTLEILNLATLYFALPRMSTAPQTPNSPPPAHMLTQPPWIRPLCEVVHEVHAIKIHFHHCNDEIIFVGFKIRAKMFWKLYNE